MQKSKIPIRQIRRAHCKQAQGGQIKIKKVEKKEEKKTLETKKLWDGLQKVMDPELGISIVDLGLIYTVNIDEKGLANVKMTLTSMGCPLFGMMESDMKKELLKIKGVRNVFIELTFEPPWNPDMMSKDGKAKLGLI